MTTYYSVNSLTKALLNIFKYTDEFRFVFNDNSFTLTISNSYFLYCSNDNSCMEFPLTSTTKDITDYLVKYYN